MFMWVGSIWGGHSCPPRPRQRPAFDVGPTSQDRVACVFNQQSSEGRAGVHCGSVGRMMPLRVVLV